MSSLPETRPKTHEVQEADAGDEQQRRRNQLPGARSAPAFFPLNDLAPRSSLKKSLRAPQKPLRAAETRA